jgi:hypothetical protein
VPTTVASEILHARARARRTLSVDRVRAACCALILEHAALLESAAAELRHAEVALACAADPAAARGQLHRARAAAAAAGSSLERMREALADPRVPDEALAS